jgi:hypothetical protein
MSDIANQHGTLHALDLSEEYGQVNNFLRRHSPIIYAMDQASFHIAYGRHHLATDGGRTRQPRAPPRRPDNVNAPTQVDPAFHYNLARMAALLATHDDGFNPFEAIVR